ncbi:MAG: P-loop NTPase fold protein [bacterium]
MEEKKKIVVFSDAPISEESDDKFAHNVLTETLSSAIETALDHREAINVGLFGRWGAGKTSVINLLCKHIEKNTTLTGRVRILVFNVWKYSFDSLRRQFLIFLDSEEGLKTGLKIQDELDTSTEKSTSRTKIDWRNAFLALLLTGLVFLILTYLGKESVVSSSVLSILILLLVYFFQEYRKGITKEETSKKTTHRLDQADQFERKFKEVMATYRKKSKGRKLIMVFDDLDRCPEQTIFETLSMIKTFLGEEDCIYIIPCDDERIKNHLVGKMGYTPENADEFLRKFFQVCLRIPPFGEEDIFSYTHELADKAGFPKEIEKVIASAFAETPRHVKYFLNNLSVLFNIAAEKEKQIEGKPGSIRQGLVTGNPALLAKVEAMRVKWPEAFGELSADESLLTILEGIITGRTSQISPEKQEKAKNILKHSVGLKKFLFSTIDIKKQRELSAFVKLSEPLYSSTLSDCGEFLVRALTGDIEFAKSKLMDPESGEEYLNALLDVVRKKVDTGYPDQAFNALHILVETYPDLSSNIQQRAGQEIVVTFNRAEIKNKVWVVTMPKLFQALTDTPGELASELIRELALQIGDFSKEPPNLNNQREVVESLIIHWTKLNQILSDVYTSVRNNISKAYKTQPDKAKIFIEAIVKSQNLDAQRSFINDALFPEMIEKLSNGTTPSDVEMKNFLIGLRQITSDRSKLVVLGKCLEILKVHTANSIDPPKRFALDLISAYDPPKTLGPKEKEFFEVVNSLVANLASQAEKIEAIYIFFKFAQILQERTTEPFCKNLTNFINSNDANFAKQLIGAITRTGNQVPTLVWTLLRPRSIALGDQELIDIVFKYYVSAQDEAKKYFTELLNHNIPLATTLFLKNHSELSEELNGGLIEVLIQKSRSVPPNQLPQIFDPIVQAINITPPEYRDMFGERLLELIRDFEQQPGGQEIGLQFILRTKEKLSDTKKQYITSQLISKARTQQISPMMQLPIVVNLLKGVILLQENLPEDSMEDLIDYLLPLVVTETLPASFRITGCDLLRQVRAIPVSRRDQVLRGLFDGFKLNQEQPLKEAFKNCLVQFRDAHADWKGWKEVEQVIQPKESPT